MVHDEKAAVAAPEQLGPGADAGFDAVTSQVEALRRDPVGRVEDGRERDPLVTALEGATIKEAARVDLPVEGLEDAEEWRLAVMGREAAEEPGVGGDAQPALAGGGGAWEGGRLRREAEEDLPE